MMSSLLWSFTALKDIVLVIVVLFGSFVFRLKITTYIGIDLQIVSFVYLIGVLYFIFSAVIFGLCYARSIRTLH